MAIHFISDLHLDAARPDICNAFFSYLEHLPADVEQLYILGDFFEVWIGDDAVDAFSQQIIDALKSLHERGIAVSFVHGNRDFLIGPAFAALARIQLLPDTFVLHAHGRRFLLMHGDSLCTSDTRYMAFRQQVRTPAWQAELLGKSIPERAAIARGLRENSRSETAQKAEYITDVTPSAVVDAMTAADIDTLIHGHTHRPAVHRFAIGTQPATRYVLGDWDKFGFDIRLTESTVELRRFPLDDCQAATVFGA